MALRWFRREHDRSVDPAADEVDQRLQRQAARAGRTVEDEQEEILRDVLPNVRKAVVDAGLTIGQYLQLDRAEYAELLDAQPGPSLLGRGGGLVDYESFVRLRRWILAAAERADEDPESWATRAGTSAPRRPWQRSAGTAGPVRANRPAASGGSAGTVPATPPASPAVGGDELLDRLERLAALRDSGALTEDEFQVQKRRLLDSAP